MIENNVFSRTEVNGNILSNRLYNLAIGMLVLWGIGLNFLMVQTIPPEFVYSIGQLPFLIGYFVAIIIGWFMIVKSENPVISFIGYNIIAVPLGLVLVAALPQFSPDAIHGALMLTTLITFAMMVVSTMFPSFFLGLGRTLFVTLLICLAVELTAIFIFKVDLAFMDYIVAGLFSMYIGYDWARANAIPKTLDNAVDSAAALYVDIVILFLRLARILNRN